MNLLTNLLAFSSLNASADKEERPSSSGGRFMFEESEMNSSGKERVTSKSLSKMSFMSNQNSKVDPKKKCLHRIAHTFKMKIRKHYYGVFVILESMKKNNITIHMLNLNPQMIEQGVIKVAQTFSILCLKQYENGNKREFFQKINKFSQIANFAKTIAKVCDGNVQRRYGSHLLSYSKNLEKLEIKIDLLASSIEDIQKKTKMFLFKETFSFIKETNKLYDLPQKYTLLIQNEEKVMIKNLPLLTDSNTESIAYQNLPEKASIESSCIPTEKQTLHEQKEFELCDQSKITFTINSYPVQGHEYQSRYSLMENTIQNCRSTSKSPYRNCKKILNIRESIDCGSLSLNTYQKITKAYEVSLNLSEKPLELESLKENMPKMIPKINPQELSSHEVEDLADKSNIFRDRKPNYLSEELELEQSIRETMFDLEMNNDKYEMNERSEISYIPHMQHESSMSILNHKEDSSFGCEAVNFKNSLVLERESMKKSDRTKVEVHLKKKNHQETSDLDFNLKRRNTPKTICPERKINSELNNYESTFEELIKEGSETSNFSHNFNFKKSNSNFGETNHDYHSDIKNNIPPNLIFTQPVVRKLRYGSISEIEMKPHELNSSASTSRSPIQSIDQMPVRDVGMDATKLKYRNNSTSSIKDLQSKKFLNGKK